MKCRFLSAESRKGRTDMNGGFSLLFNVCNVHPPPRQYHFPTLFDFCVKPPAICGKERFRRQLYVS